MSKHAHDSDNATLSHELVNQEADNVAFFLTAIAIQFYVTRFAVQHQIPTPFFISRHLNRTLNRSQRVFVRIIFSDPKFKEIAKSFALLFLNLKNNENPTNIITEDVNYGFLVRQLFLQSKQIIDKYDFIKQYKGQLLTSISIDKLAHDLQDLTFMEHVISLASIFSYLDDDYDDDITVRYSLQQNIERRIMYYKNNGNNKNFISYLYRMKNNFK